MYNGKNSTFFFLCSLSILNTYMGLFTFSTKTEHFGHLDAIYIKIHVCMKNARVFCGLQQ